MSFLSERSEVVIGLFRDLFQCEGMPFGSPSIGIRGVWDGTEGVQWNAGYLRDDQCAWIGVNLEGLEYDGWWPIARFIKRELAHPLLLDVRNQVARPREVTVVWSREAWQRSSRVPIMDARIRPTPVALHRLDREGWLAALKGASECLNPEKQLLGRGIAEIRRLPSLRKEKREVVPHLTFETRFNVDTTRTHFKQMKENLEVLHEFVTRQAART